MIPFNFHQHSQFSDGKEAPEAYVRQALSIGFEAMGFTEHSPLPFPTYYSLKKEEEQLYMDEIDRLKSLYSDRIKLYRGLEQDYIPRLTEPFSVVAQRLKLDYSIGSVHLIGSAESDELWFIDGPDRQVYDDGFHRHFGKNIRKAVTQYYHQINEMIENESFDVVGHLDKIKMHNAGRFFSVTDQWYTNLTLETLELISHKGLLVEVNTRGIYKKRSDSYFPDGRLLKAMSERNIPILVSSDAHLPGELNLGFEAAKEHLLAYGFNEICYFAGNSWSATSLR